MNNDLLIEKLNAPKVEDRLNALRELKNSIGDLEDGDRYTNNHVHSIYSFSPYSPTSIIYEAYMAGLDTAGLMDHDSLAGAEEFIEAGKIMKIATTVGFEIRTDWSDTPFKDVALNNPDQKGCAYICVHGVPHQNIDKAEKYLSKIRAARNERNKKMVDKISEIVKGINLSFEDDVLPISKYSEGGSVTERHILYVLGQKIYQKTKTRKKLAEYISKELDVSLSDTQQRYIENEKNDIFMYDLLNILKSSFVEKMYVEAEYPEILPIEEVLDFIHEIGAIPTYAYLGDVGSSVTGDKKAQKFEDSYLDELIEYVKDTGFDAVAYMPSRNSHQQLSKLQDLCKKYELFEINGEDINQPRQSFVCEQLMDDDYIHLIDNTWALVGHEVMASKDISLGLFSGDNKSIKLSKKLDTYAIHGFNAFNN